jgi:DNA-3-methyladenine glycosylase II
MADGRRAVRYNHAEALSHLAAADPKLGALISRVGPYTLRLQSTHSPFEALLESIIYQQLHGKAAAAILARLLTTFGDMHPSPELVLRVPESQLRGAGISAAKTAAIRDLAAKTVDGTVPTLARIRRMSDEEIIARLSAVRGIGTWTAEMFLIFRLGRPDVLPVTDFGVRKGFALTFQKLKPHHKLTPDLLATPAQIARRAEKWRPWRSVASWYLWRANDLARTDLIERQAAQKLKLQQK